MRKGFLLELGMLIFIFLLVLIVSVTGIITYKNLISLATGLKEGNTTNNKVSVLKQITADLYQTESNVRAFYFTRDSAYLKDNATVRDKVDKQLSVLMSYTNEGSV